jgi:hypothetical protein
MIESDVNEKIANRYFNDFKKIYVHYKDYERYLININNNQYQKNYAVFLDEAIFSHPDNYYLKSDKVLKSQKIMNLYFKELNIFFDDFERVTNNKIIIASHPKNFMNFNNKYYFNDRKVFINKTYELVRNSTLVFAHASTSVAYAVILKKPIAFLVSSVIFDIGYFTKTLSFSIETGSKIIDINNRNINYNNLFNQDFSIYKNYLNKFIKSSKSKNNELWDIVGSEINSKINFK